MNLKGFKKVHEDDEKAVMKNQHGHQITIAKKALTGKHLDELKKLPLYAADGTDTQDVPPEPVATPATTEDPSQGTDSWAYADQAAAQANQADDTNQGQDTGDESATATDTQDASASTPGMQAAPQEQAPEESPIDAATQKFSETKQSILQGSSDWEQALNAGQVTPQTYQSLFNSKDTLGKIGTLFGLLLGGAGSGLTHQPNALLEQMNKQITNDLEAQKTSKANAMNFLQLNYQHQLQEAQKQHLLAGIPLTQAQTQLTKAEAAQKAQAVTYAQMGYSALHHMALAAQKAPPGSQAQIDAQNQLAAAYPFLQNEIGNVADKAAAGVAAMHATAGAQSPSGSAINFQKWNDLRRQSQMKLPGAPGDADLQNMTKEADQVGDVQLLKNDFLNAYDKLHGMALAGKLSPNLQTSITKPLIAKAAKLGEGRYTESANEAYSSLLPKWNDWGNTPAEKRQEGSNFFDTLMGSHPTMTQFGVMGAAPMPKNMPAKATGSSEIRYDAKGNAWKMGPNGKPVRVH